MVKTELSSLSTHSPSSSSAAAAATVAAAIKRKKPEELELNGAKKKPRTRVRYVHHPPCRHSLSSYTPFISSYSCGECHRRKQKVRAYIYFIVLFGSPSHSHPPQCDRQIPCSHVRLTSSHHPPNDFISPSFPSSLSTLVHSSQSPRIMQGIYSRKV